MSANIRPYEGISLDNFAEWCKAGWTRRTDTPHDRLRELSVMALGLAGESGEVIEHIKKEIRGDGPLDKQKLKLELGDVLHYACRIALEYGITMNDVMVSNIEKIESRRGNRAWEKT